MMYPSKHGVLAPIMLVFCFVYFHVRSIQALPNAGVIYAIERHPEQKNIFALDFSAGAGMTPGVTLITNMTQAAADDPEGFPMQCFGYVNGETGTGELYEFSPNGLAHDADSRLYFAALDQYGGTSSRLCFYSMVTNSFEFAAELGEVVMGATFDATLYQYVWLDEGKHQSEAGILVLQFARLDRATGQVLERVTNTMFRNVTTDPNAPAAELPFTFRGGDLVIDCNGVLYGSSVGTGGGFKYFFAINLNHFATSPGNVSSMPYEYRLIHADTSDDPSQVSTLTGFATADQLAFDMMERLISQDSERGIFSVVDPGTGANGELGVKGVDFIQLTEMGMLRTFADLASTLNCDARVIASTCSQTQIMDPCEDEMVDVMMPDEGGEIQCVLVQGHCRQADSCNEEHMVACDYYVSMGEWESVF
ncbi:hypothetical protein FVE85_6375 [Porphyridium purpureum]|uniref:Uncharacterized protein n=1 Tax=Porphyridium purpureum TaxID=35688 RepID=A0A5J4Z6C9_PORPP|nr:hypothetical protein FVE85_6375 [Porphyridium purpureum]|eukprot:POR3079..scf295_1